MSPYFVKPKSLRTLSEVGAHNCLGKEVFSSFCLIILGSQGFHRLGLCWTSCIEPFSFSCLCFFKSPFTLCHSLSFLFSYPEMFFGLQNFIRLQSAWGWVDYEWMFMFGWTDPLKGISTFCYSLIFLMWQTQTAWDPKTEITLTLNSGLYRSTNNQIVKLIH